VRSFDAQRPRSAPTSFHGLTLTGEPIERTFRGLTLIVAIKPHCDGCREFAESTLNEFSALDVIFVTAEFDLDNEWRDVGHEIVVAPALLIQLDVRWPPFYILVDADSARVLVEGVIFAPGQVAEEISPYLPD